MVQRYAMCSWGEPEMSEFEEGDWVAFDDYEELQQQLENVKAVIDEADYPSETMKRICAILYPESE